MTRLAKPKIEAFDFEHWSAIGTAAPDDPLSHWGLRLSDVTVSPDDRYAFAVFEGFRKVIAFHFPDFPSAMSASRQMQSLLPVIESVRSRPAGRHRR